MLLCPVRHCHKAMQREGKRVVCPEGHSFDVARSGYLNLLQPQERRSASPGDSKQAVLARRRLHDRGFSQPMFDAVLALLSPGPGDTLLDIGCGEGFYGGSLEEATGCAARGVDISIPAIDLAARRYPGCEWVVANADRFIPYSDGAFTNVLSVTARMNSPEFRRVLHSEGQLLVAVPGPEDLVELRGAGRDRVEQTIQAFSSEFVLRGQRRITTTADLEADSVQDVLLSIYRPNPAKQEGTKRVTFSLDLLLFSPS